MTFHLNTNIHKSEFFFNIAKIPYVIMVTMSLYGKEKLFSFIV